MPSVPPHVHPITVSLIYGILLGLKSFAMPEVGKCALLFLQRTLKCEQQPKEEARSLGS